MEALEIELNQQSIPFASKPLVEAYYKGRLLHRKYVPDLIGKNTIVIELKAVSKLLPEHKAQLLNYMRLTRKPVGYLVNFGPVKAVEWKRFILGEFSTTHER